MKQTEPRARMSSRRAAVAPRVTWEDGPRPAGGWIAGPQWLSPRSSGGRSLRPGPEPPRESAEGGPGGRHPCAGLARSPQLGSGGPCATCPVKAVCPLTPTSFRPALGIAGRSHDHPSLLRDPRPCPGLQDSPGQVQPLVHGPHQLFTSPAAKPGFCPGLPGRRQGQASLRPRAHRREPDNHCPVACCHLPPQARAFLALQPTPPGPRSSPERGSQKALSKGTLAPSPEWTSRRSTTP